MTERSQVQVLAERETPGVGTRNPALRSPSTCPDCNHPAGFHTNGICSMAACYCKRSFDEKPEATANAAKRDGRLRLKGA